MIKDVLQAWASTKIETQEAKYACKYCQKKFTKESTLLTHLCEKKRRVQQEKEVGVQLGLQSYLMFYQTTQAGSKVKNYEDFSESPYYSAFVKYGRYCVDIRCINFKSFTQWLLKNNKKLDYWCSDKLYEEWMLEYLKREPVSDALERGLKEMEEYAVANSDLKNGFSDYFRYGNSNRIIHHISAGRISPWVVFNCSSGVNFLSSLSDDQAKLIMPYINPVFWNSHFNELHDDVAWARNVLKVAGL